MTAPIDELHPLITVCIANYNGMAVIDDCIRSVLEQKDAPSVEIIVHDDASTDASAEHIRRHYPDVRLIESPENVGFCIANNRMVAQARAVSCCSTTMRPRARMPWPPYAEPRESIRQPPFSPAAI